MKVCLINPPDPSEKISEDIEYSYGPYTVPHIGLGYIYSTLKQEDIEVDIIECMAERVDLEALYKLIDEKRYDIIGITCYDSNTYNVVKVANKIKQINYSTFVFIGGCHATIMYESLLKITQNIDCCVIGEGEITCLQLIKTLENREDYKNINGIAYRQGNDIFKTNPRPLIDDINKIPFPYRKFISPKGIATVVTSRGCYGNCIFCPTKIQYLDYGKKLNIRYRSAENVVDEIEYLVEKNGVKYINFDDDNFLYSSNSNKERIRQIIEEIEKRSLKFTFSITSRANDILANKEILNQLKAIGLEYIFIGIESFSQRQLDFFKKDTTIQQNIEAIKYLADIGVKIDMGFLYLEPYTTIGEILKNLNMLNDLEIYKHMYITCRLISMYSPLIAVYKSKFFEYIKSSGLLTNNRHGYKFLNKNVELYYKICREWSKRVYPLYLNYYLIMKARELNKIELAARLENERANLAKNDIEFLIELCSKIKSKNIRFEESKDFILEWETKLRGIVDVFAVAKEKLS